jgi:hypothetical protein
MKYVNFRISQANMKVNLRFLVVVVLLGVGQTQESQAGGIFGFWNSDESLPYFEFTMDELTDPQASWPNTEQVPPLNVTRTDHFYLFGNSRINVKGVDDGYVELFSTERGPMFCNKYEPDYSNLAGGFSYIASSALTDEVISTAYIYGPHGPNTQWKRQFHVGHYHTSLEVDNILIVSIEIVHCVLTICVG